MIRRLLAFLRRDANRAAMIARRGQRLHNRDPKGAARYEAVHRALAVRK